MISLRYALHPYYPSRLGFEALLRLTHPSLGRCLEATRFCSISPARQRVTIYREALAVLDRGIPGDVAVIGAHRGGTAAPLALLLKDRPERRLHLFDRWGDLPDPTPEDGFRAEQYRKDRIPEKLAELKDRPPLDDCRHVMHDIVGLSEAEVAYYPGWFDGTFAEGGSYPGAPLAFALVHCDYYEIGAAGAGVCRAAHGRRRRRDRQRLLLVARIEEGDRRVSRRRAPPGGAGDGRAEAGGAALLKRKGRPVRGALLIA